VEIFDKNLDFEDGINLSREEIISCVLLFGKTTEVLKLSRS
jgi:hypothetical protein